MLLRRIASKTLDPAVSYLDLVEGALAQPKLPYRLLCGRHRHGFCDLSRQETTPSCPCLASFSWSSCRLLDSEQFLRGSRCYYEFKYVVLRYHWCSLRPGPPPPPQPPPCATDSLLLRKTKGVGLVGGTPRPAFFLGGKACRVLCPRTRFISRCCWADKARWLMDVSFASLSGANPVVPVVHLGVSSNHLHHHVPLTAAPTLTRDSLFKTTSSHISHLALHLHTPHTTSAPSHTPSSFPLT
jgi:hypothetical protein